MRIIACAVLALPAAIALQSAPAGSQTVEEAFKGKTISLVVGYGAGGGYDRYARLLAKYMPGHIPGEPSFVVRNQPGAGSLNALNAVYNSGVRDGTSIVHFGPEVAFEPLRSGQGIKFDPLKLIWLGSMNRQVSIAVTMARSGITRIEQTKQRVVNVGASGSGSQSNLNPYVYNAYLGTRFKVVTGFPGTKEITLGMERGELDGIAGWSWDSLKLERPEWMKSKDISIILQVSDRRHRELPNVPNIYDLVTGEDDRRVLDVIFAHQLLGRPFVLPPDVPTDRVSLLRRAFDRTLADPKLIEEAGKIRLELDIVDGDTITRHVERIFATPKPLLDRAAKAIAEAVSAGK